MVMLTAKPEQIDVDFSKSVAVVVDMQNAFVSNGGMFDLAGFDISKAPEVIETNRRLLERCRAAGTKIVYLQMTYQPDLSDAGGPESPNYHKELGLILMRDRPELDGTLLIEGTWDWQIVDELTPQPGDYIVKKTRYSGFVGTNLETYLRSNQVRNLMFTGVATNVCVGTTAQDAYFAEFWPVLVEDAINHSGPDFNRESTLWNFENVFGWVTEADNLIDAMERKTN
jgi:ureidoacrylate peracid hydrolase